jgi:hypothetical protein
MKFPSNTKTGEYLDQAAAATWAKTNGGIARPQPPRNIQAQSGSRKILVTWDAPLVAGGIIGYRIYTENELSLLATINDSSVRQYGVPASAGSSPPTKNIFVSSFSQRGESVQVQIQGKASVEAGAPSDPSVPAGSAASGTTGGKPDRPPPSGGTGPA